MPIGVIGKPDDVITDLAFLHRVKETVDGGGGFDVGEVDEGLDLGEDGFGRLHAAIDHVDHDVEGLDGVIAGDADVGLVADLDGIDVDACLLEGGKDVRGIFA